jgi:hypothetical protein
MLASTSTAALTSPDHLESTLDFENASLDSRLVGDLPRPPRIDLGLDPKACVGERAPVDEAQWIGTRTGG